VGASADPDKLPKIFFVNWFRRDENGRFLWPGFGENSRVLAWVFDRVSGRGDAVDTPIGWLPAKGAIDVGDLGVSDADMDALLSVDIEGWRKELPLIEEFYSTFGDRVPSALRTEVSKLDDRLSAS